MTPLSSSPRTCILITPRPGQSPQSRRPPLCPPIIPVGGRRRRQAVPPSTPLSLNYSCRRPASAASSPAVHPSVPRLLLSAAGIPASLPSVIPASSKRESSVFASPTSQSPSSCLKRESNAVSPPPPHPHPLPQGEREKEVVPTDAVSAGPLSEEEGEGWPRLDWFPALLNSRPGPLDSRSPITNVGDKLRGNDGRVRCGQRPTTNPAPLSPDSYSPITTVGGRRRGPAFPPVSPLSPDYFCRGQALAAGIPAVHPSVPQLLLSGAGIPASLPSVIPAVVSGNPVFSLSWKWEAPRTNPAVVAGGQWPMACEFVVLATGSCSLTTHHSSLAPLFLTPFGSGECPR